MQNQHGIIRKKIIRISILLVTLILLFIISLELFHIADSENRLTTSQVIKHLDPKLFNLENYYSNDEYLNYKTDSIFSTINDSQKISQMIISSLGKNGRSMNEILRLIKEKKIGGINVMDGSFSSLKNDIHDIKLFIKSNNSLPILFSIDGEPGLINKRISGIDKFPFAREIKDEKECFTISNKINNLLEEMGIDQNYSPVCDFSYNKQIIGERSFGKDFNEIVNKANVIITNSISKNIIPTAKHFPGHGNVKGDSHRELVYIDSSLSELNNFKSVIDSGIISIMVGHIAINNNSYNTQGYPSSLSYLIVTDLLRNTLNFKGLIISDAMNMGAVTNFNKPAFTCAKAGCDLILMPTDERKLWESIREEMLQNEDFKKQIYNSVKRIIRAKICLQLI